MYLTSQLTIAERKLINEIMDRFALGQNDFLLENTDENWQLYLDCYDFINSNVLDKKEKQSVLIRKRNHNKRPATNKQILLYDEILVCYIKHRIKESISSQERQLQKLWRGSTTTVDTEKTE